MDEQIPKEKKTADMKKYQREYMKKRYDANPEQSRNYASANYYVKIGLATKEELKVFGNLLPFIVKAQKSLDELKQLNYSMFLLFLDTIDKSPKIDPEPENI